jgi:hypothetical protein
LNVAARIIVGLSRSANFSAILADLHRLKASERIEFKLVVITRCIVACAARRHIASVHDCAGSRRFQRSVDFDHPLVTRWMSDRRALPAIVILFLRQPLHVSGFWNRFHAGWLCASQRKSGTITDDFPPSLKVHAFVQIIFFSVTAYSH